MRSPSHAPLRDLLLTLAPSQDGAGCHAILQNWTERTELAADPLPPFDSERWETEHLNRLRGFIDRPVPISRLRKLGRDLGRLLPPRILARLLAEIQQGILPGSRVRLRLVLEDPFLAGLPWEFLSLEGGASNPGGFLCLQPHVSLVRQSPAARAVEPVAADPLRVLIACADPRSPHYPALPQLMAEARSVMAELQTPSLRQRVEVEPLFSATPSSLERALQEQSPHILHFIGHGDARALGGFLVLEGDRPGVERVVYADELARWLAGGQTRLALLSACHSAASAHSVASALARYGVPAVVAMQLPLRDTAARSFAREFYGALAEPCSVEEALSMARHAVQGYGADWGVPVLYLTGDTSDLFVLSRTEAAPAPLPPTNVPYPHNPFFVGRETLLEQVDAVLRAPVPPRAALVGMGGLGKTQLAVEYAHAHLRDYPGGVFWINARDSLRVQDEYAALSRFFPISDDLKPHERAARVRDHLQQLPQPTLLIFDNVTEETDLALLPSAGLCRILATTRLTYLKMQGFQAFSLPLLEETAALSLLQTHRQAEGEADLEAARQIAAKMEYLPLALNLVAQYVDQVDMRFADYRQRHLDPDRIRQSLFATIEVSFSSPSLKSLAPYVLSVASCFAGRGISRDLLYEASGIASREDFEEAVSQLTGLSLLTREQDRRLTVHELVREFAQEQMTESGRCAVILRVARVLTRHLSQANEAKDWKAFRQELVHCRVVIDLCREQKIDAGLEKLLREMGRYQYHHGDYPAALAYFEEGLEVAERRFGKQHLHVALLYCHLGQTKHFANDPSTGLALVREALAIATSRLKPNNPHVATFFNSLGYVLKLQGYLEEALLNYNKALEIDEQAYGQKHPDVAICLNNLGTLFESLGDFETARKHLLEAMDILRATGGEHHPYVASYGNNLGRVLGKMGRWGEALEYHQQALGILESAYGRRHLLVAHSYFYIAEAYFRLDQYELARRNYEEAWPIYEQCCSPDNIMFGRIRERLEQLDAKDTTSD